jgi:hypothetical protein
MAIEKQMGCTFDRWNTMLTEGSMQAMTSLVWLLRSRTEPGLRVGDIHFKMGELGFVDDEVEDDAPGVHNDVVSGGGTATVDPKDPEVSGTPPDLSITDA